jgi:hypothetical protein
MFCFFFCRRPRSNDEILLVSALQRPVPHPSPFLFFPAMETTRSTWSEVLRHMPSFESRNFLASTSQTFPYPTTAVKFSIQVSNPISSPGQQPNRLTSNACPHGGGRRRPSSIQQQRARAAYRVCRPSLCVQCRSRLVSPTSLYLHGPHGSTTCQWLGLAAGRDEIRGAQ